MAFYPHRASAATSLRIKLDIVIRIGPILRELIDCAQRNALADHSASIGKWLNLGHSPRKLSPRSDLCPSCQLGDVDYPSGYRRN
eukprot:jgi/Botrbrau1/8953/Bobra.0148s0066.1